MSKIEFIRDKFGRNYIHEAEIAPPNQLQHHIFNGCRIHTRSGIKTLIRMLKPKNILEIGSFHFETTNQMAYALDEIGADETCKVVSFDIRPGGYDGHGGGPNSTRIINKLWLPHKTTFDDWKYTDEYIKSTEFSSLNNDEIFVKNLETLKSVTPVGGFDLVYIDGDHSFQGANYDHLYSKEVVNKEAVLVIDDIWDRRLQEVRNYFDSIQTEKWDFYEFNIQNKDKVQNMGVFFP